MSSEFNLEEEPSSEECERASIRLGCALIYLPPAMAALFAVTYLATQLKLNTIGIQINKDFVGITYDNYSGNQCHLGIHPEHTQRDLHEYCNNPVLYNLIIPKVIP